MTLKIFYIDDEIDLCELFQDLFSSKNVMIKTYSNPILAIEEFHIESPDLIFVDYRMPMLNGVELAKKLQTTISIYMVTGENNMTQDYPFADILKKPFDIQLIRKIIESYKTVPR